MLGIGFCKDYILSKKSDHILIVVSLKWQLAGFLMAAHRLGPKKITVIKLRPFNVTLSDYSSVDEIDISVVDAFGFYDINPPSFLSAVKQSFLSFDRFRSEVLNNIAPDNFVIITDNEHRTIEYFLRFGLSSVRLMHVYEHGLVARESDWRTLLVRKSKAIVRWTIFRGISVIKHNKTLPNGNVIKKQYYSVHKNKNSSRRSISGDIFLYSNSLRISKIKKVDSNVLIFFSSGAFRYSDDVFIKDTVAAYLTAKSFAKKNGLQFYVKLKEMESKQYLIAADKTLHLTKFIDGDLDFYDCINNYHPRLLVCAGSSTILAESYLSGVDVLIYSVSSKIIVAAHSEKWVDAGVKMITPGGVIPKNRINTLGLIKELYNINAAKEHLERFSSR